MAAAMIMLRGGVAAMSVRPTCHPEGRFHICPFELSGQCPCVNSHFMWMAKVITPIRVSYIRRDLGERVH